MVPDELYDRSATSLLSHSVGSDGPVPLVVGAPHHAPAGVGRLKCDRTSDQNTGLLAWRIAEVARVPVVIATNADIDPNKDLDSEYSRAVASYCPRVLLEIHGHGGRRARFDVEVSAGSSNRMVYSTKFAEALSLQMATDPDLGELSVSGDFDRIYFKARNTATMQSEDWLGIHVEFPLFVRKQGTRAGLPAAGRRLASYVAAALPTLTAAR